jgi:3-oxoadipate enol-lactonase
MYVRTRLGRWYYEEHGDPKGTPIVLWHSLLCDGGMWDAQIRTLAELGRVIVFDGPAHGRSEAPPPFTLWENAEAIVDAFDELKIDKAIWCGLSWGGMVGMRLAIAHPDRVRALVLLDTNAQRDSRYKRAKYTLLAQLIKPAGIPERLFMRAIAPLFFGERSFRERPELADAMYRTLAGWPTAGISRVSMAVTVARDDVTEKLGSIRAPTLVIHGEDDRAIAMESARSIASHIAGAKLVPIPFAGHLSTIEEPAAVNAALVPFVRAAL